MELWWSELALAHKIFYTIAIVTSVVMVIQLILSFFGFDGDTDVDADADFDVDHGGGGGGVFSIRAVTGFFTGFGWGGVAALESGLGLPASIAVALGSGGVLMAAIVLLMRAIYSLRYEGTLDYRNAIGAPGSAYIPVPAAMSGPGQVEVEVQGRLCVVRAFTRSPARIPTRGRIRVVDVLDQQTLLVEPLDSAPAATAGAPSSASSENPRPENPRPENPTEG